MDYGLLFFVVCGLIASCGVGGFFLLATIGGILDEHVGGAFVSFLLAVACFGAFAVLMVFTVNTF